MSITKLFIVVIISIALLIAHSYFKRGFRLTFNFFLFALIAAMRKEIGTFFGSEELTLKGSPFFFPETGIPFAVSFLTVISGWIFTFYIAWALSEKITDRLGYFSNKIFTTLLFAGMIVGSMSYAIEAVGVNIGWWTWKFHDGRFSGFLAGDAHFFAIEAWFYFAVHFLTVYFLIECSKFRHAGWKCVFFLIYFIRTWAIVFSGGQDLLRIAEERIMLCLLIILSFSAPLEFDMSAAVKPRFSMRMKPSFLSYKLFNAIPFLVIFNVIGVLIFMSVVKIKNVQMAVSFLPLAVLVLLAIRKINPAVMVIFCLSLLVCCGTKAVPAVLPVVLFMVFRLSGKKRAACA